MFEEIAQNHTLVGAGVVVTFLCGIPVAYGLFVRVRIFWNKYHYRTWNIYKDYNDRIQLSAMRADESHTYFVSVMWMKFTRVLLLLMYYYILREVYKIFREIGINALGHNHWIDQSVKIIFFGYFFVVGIIIVANLYEMNAIARGVKRKHSDGLEGD
jgi:hypothetical protein